MENCETCAFQQDWTCTNQNSPMLGVKLKPCFSCDQWSKKTKEVAG